MKIVYVTATFPFGIGESFLIPELQALTRAGNEVLVVPVRARKELIHADAREFLGRTRKAGLFSGTVLRQAIKTLFARRGAAARVLSLLRGNQSWPALAKNLVVVPKSLWLAELARQWGADHIHAYWASAPATTAMLASEFSGLSWSFTAHRYDIVEKNLLHEKVKAATFGRFISESGLRLAENLAELSKDKCVVLHVGVDIPQSFTGCDIEAQFVAVCAANLIPVKGHKYLIESVSMLRRRQIPVEIWIAGQGPLRNQLESYARRLGVADQVRFVGQLPHQQLLDLYRSGKVHAVVLPSVDLGDGEHEGIPVSLVEAMSYAVPVVGTKTGGIPELLSGGAGLLVTPADPTAIAEALQTLVMHPDLRTRFGLAGRKRVQEAFNVETLVQELLVHFKSSSTIVSATPLQQSA